MAERLRGKKIAVLVTDGFEESELTGPVSALQAEGAEVRIVSPEPDSVRGWKDDEWGRDHSVDVRLEDAHPEDFDALVLPGGVMNPDRLRKNADAVKFVGAFFQEGKPIGAICHGPWTLIEVGAAKGRRMTSYASLRTDLVNAGAKWVDEPVVTDRGIVTSRNPGDLEAFNAKLIEEFEEGRHARMSGGEERRAAG